VAAVAALVLAGCGSSKLSSKQLRARATAACTVAARKTTHIPTPTDPAGGAAFLKRGIAVLTPAVAALKRLKPPPDVANVFENSVHGLEKQLDLVERTARYLRDAQDPVLAMKTLQQRLTPIEAGVDSGWRALEIPACINL
jgi:hypothetical protein